MKTITCHDVEGNTFDVSADKLKWRPSVYGIVVKDDKLLLVPQYDGYDLPGGGADLGETMEEAVVREVKEETGITVKPIKLLELHNSFYRMTHGRGDTQCLMIYYLCEALSGEITTDGFDEHEKEYARAAEWVELSRLEEIKQISSVDFVAVAKRALNSNI